MATDSLIDGEFRLEIDGSRFESSSTMMQWQGPDSEQVLEAVNSTVAALKSPGNMLKEAGAVLVSSHNHALHNISVSVTNSSFIECDAGAPIQSSELGAAGGAIHLDIAGYIYSNISISESHFVNCRLEDARVDKSVDDDDDNSTIALTKQEGTSAYVCVFIH